jgi:hypothetical protein
VAGPRRGERLACWCGWDLTAQPLSHGRECPASEAASGFSAEAASGFSAEAAYGFACHHRPDINPPLPWETGPGEVPERAPPLPTNSRVSHPSLNAHSPLTITGSAAFAAFAAFATRPIAATTRANR